MNLESRWPPVRLIDADGRRDGVVIAADPEIVEERVLLRIDRMSELLLQPVSMRDDTLQPNLVVKIEAECSSRL